MVVAAAWAAALALRGALPAGPGLPPLEPARAASLGLMLLPLWAAALATSGAWTRPGAVPALRAALLASVLAIVASWLLRVELNRSLLVGLAALATPGLLLLRRWRPAPAATVAVLGPDRDRVAPLLASRGLRVVEGLDPAADEVVVAGRLDPDALLALASEADRRGLPLTLDASHVGPRTAKAELREVEGWTGVTFRPSSDAEPARLVKRAADLAGAAALLVALAPLLALVALAIRAADGGPALFVQERVGRYGRRFRMVKLRTMVPDAEARLPSLLERNEIGGAAFKMRDDPRVTPIGRWLRRFSLDELPQLLNVLAGDMSLVGPRPPLPAEVARWERWQWRRLSVRPGLTGLWQVSGRADLPWESWIRLDLEYVDRWSLWLDLTVLARTIPVVLQGTGAR